MFTWSVTLSGEVFHVRLDDDNPDYEPPRTDYPVIIRHVSSGMEYDTVAESINKTMVLSDKVFAADLSSFYYSLYHKKPDSNTFRINPDPVK
jgi:hypothetical protein